MGCNSSNQVGSDPPNANLPSKQRQAKKEKVNSAKTGARSARGILSSRRKESADELRSKATVLRDRKTAMVEETHRSKRSSRATVLEARQPPSQSLSPNKSTRPRLKSGMHSSVSSPSL